MENTILKSELLKEKIQHNNGLKIIVYASLIIIAWYCVQGTFSLWNFISLLLKLIGLL